jgi:hypothetical protein
MNFKDIGVTLGAGRKLILAGVQLGWVWLLVGASALVLVAMLYRYERHLVSRRTGWVLMSLRVAAATALVLALFEPISRVTYREQVRGRLILGVDLSESMATADAGRTIANRRALANLLDLSPAEAPESLSRREVARRLLQGPWMKAVADGRDVEGFGFSRATVSATPVALAERLKRVPKTTESTALATDWDPVLEAGLKESGSTPVVGLVLLTDGRRNAIGDPAAIADRLAARGIPVFPVMIGSTVPPRDAAIAAVRAPDGVYKGDVAPIEVTLKVDVPAGTEVSVTLDRPGASPIRKMVKSLVDGGRPVVGFQAALETVGPQTLTLTVGPLQGDVRPDNDRRSVTIQVADDKVNVLLVEGAPRWEFRYLRNALIRDPRVSVEAVVFNQPPAPSSAERSYKDELPMKPDPSSNAPDPLGAFDAIIVGDVAPEHLSADAWARLDSYVAERGGTLVIAGGPRLMELFAAKDYARKLLPVLDPRPVPFDAQVIDPAHPTLPAGVTISPSSSASADAWPMLQLASDSEKSREIWAGLPRLPWVVAGKAKPATTVLAVAAGAGGIDQSAVIAAMPYGLGKVLWVGADGTWRWRHRVGDVYHHRFWGQVARWASSGKLTAGNRWVRFGPDRPKVAEGDSVRLQARFSDDAPGLRPDLLVAARVYRATPPTQPGASPAATGDAVAVIPLRAKPGEPRMYEALAPSLPSAMYVIRLEAPQMSGVLKADGAPPEAILEVADRQTSERVELSALRDPLDRLASATGGQVFSDVEANALPPLLKSRTSETVKTEELPLWDRPWALLLFFTVLSAEWIVRKRAGLP